MQTIDDWKNTKVTLRVSNEPLGKVLEKVAKQAEATIEFQEVALVGIASPTTLNVKDMPLDKVLGRLIGDQNVLIRYEVGRHIIVSSYTRDEDAKKMLHIEGVVIDAKTKETLVGATVMVTDGTQKDGVRGSITDVNGKFSLQVPRKASIKVSYMGYEAVSLQVTKESTTMKIALKPERSNGRRSGGNRY